MFAHCPMPSVRLALALYSVATTGNEEPTKPDDREDDEATSDVGPEPAGTSAQSG